MPRDIVLDDSIGFIVFRAHQALRQEMYRRFAALGVDMTPEQWVVLMRLWDRDGRSQGELGDSAGRDKHTISRMIDGMIERGWLDRRADATDGRTRLVFLTRQGKALEKQLIPLAQQQIADALHGVPAAELATTIRTLRRITENMGA